ncbi:hypothetical protein SOVF_075390 [Spinacia oleracea]|nr:hypothetical protein SOVF_075390 [Spinacia oleracea]
MQMSSLSGNVQLLTSELINSVDTCLFADLRLYVKCVMLIDEILPVDAT